VKGAHACLGGRQRWVGGGAQVDAQN
jgi:hypothetical protein